MFARGPVGHGALVIVALVVLAGCGGDSSNIAVSRTPTPTPTTAAPTRSPTHTGTPTAAPTHTPKSTPTPPVRALTGTVESGLTPVSGSIVSLLAIARAGYNSAPTVLATTTSDANGNYAIPLSSFVCSPATTPVYTTATGGNAGAGPNSALRLLAALGPCNALPATVTINEVSTIASVEALAQFMNCSGGGINTSPPTGCTASSADIATSSTNVTGVSNALALGLANLFNVSTGRARGPNASGVTPPTNEINTLADILHACTASSGAASTACANLFSCAVPGATPKAGNLAPCTTPGSAVVPADTLTAALDIARNPVNNVTTLFKLVPANPPFTPTLAAAPNDWTFALNLAGGSLASPEGIAIDASGNAWVTNPSVNNVVKMGPSGAVATIFTGGGISNSDGIAIDPAGNAWVANVATAGSVTEIGANGSFISGANGFMGGMNAPIQLAIDSGGNAWIACIAGNNIVGISATGTFLTPTAGCPGTTDCGFSGGGINAPVGIAIDATGLLWVVNGSASVTELNTSGVFFSGPSGYSGGGLSGPQDLAIDPAGNAWITNFDGNSLTVFNSAGAPLSGTTGFSGGGLALPFDIAIDASGNAWVSNNLNPGSVTELSLTGAVPQALFLSGPSGFKGAGLNEPRGIAIDSAGNVWVANFRGASITEFVGVATPVLTPASACLKLNTGSAVCLP